MGVFIICMQIRCGILHTAMGNNESLMMGLEFDDWSLWANIPGVDVWVESDHLGAVGRIGGL